MPTNAIPERHLWLFGDAQNALRNPETGLLDKIKLINFHVEEMALIASSMFKWENLPDTIPARELERILMGFGVVGFFEYKGGVYAVRGGDSGEPDIYYRPTMLIVSNPRVMADGLGNYKLKNAIDLNVTYPDIKGDAVSMWNDPQRRGLFSFFEYWSGLLADAEITLEYALFNNRVKALVEGDTDDAKESIETFFDHIIKGDKLGVIAGKPMIESIKSWPFNQTASGAVKEALEAIQYIRASFFNEIGLQAQFNMKREAINGNEAGLNTFALLPRPDQMLECRREGLEWLKKTFSGFENVSVDFSSGWRLQQAEAKNQADPEPDPEPETDSKPEDKTEDEQ